VTITSSNLMHNTISKENRAKRDEMQHKFGDAWLSRLWKLILIK
jgi:hypothetical protein